MGGHRSLAYRAPPWAGCRFPPWMTLLGPVMALIRAAQLRGCMVALMKVLRMGKKKVLRMTSLFLIGVQ